jgi:hypothetical protein
MKSIKNFEEKSITESFSISSTIGGQRIYGDTGVKGKDVSILRDGQVIDFKTGVGIADGAPRD